jgi:hypothetical protein
MQGIKKPGTLTGHHRGVREDLTMTSSTSAVPVSVRKI